MCRVNRHLPRAVLTALLFCALAAPAGALANTISSTIWAGYIVQGSGALFREVAARWRQPRASCVPGARSYAAVWVGLGGSGPSSPALEQTGTEVDCSKRGHAIYYAWYELVPAASTNVPARVLIVRPGDVMSASVTVEGSRVTFSLRNDTRHRGFRKVLPARAIDVSSAEWIVEAPSDCNAAGTSCITLPLADFRSVTFRRAEAEAAGNPLGSISDPLWHWTRIDLRPGREHLGVHRRNALGSAATPSALHSGGRSFRVSYSRISLSADHVPRASASAALSARLVPIGPP
jgi:hypothetical protein